MNKIWMISGAARGLGAHIAQAALGAGDKVVVSARRPESIALADSEDVLKVRLDVTDSAQAQAAVAAAIARFGRIDVLVNNAGYGQLGPFEANAAEDAERQFATNVFGVFNLTRAVLPLMRSQRSGRVFNVSSIGGLVGMGGAALYSASKFAVEGFSECLAQEVGQFGIQVTIVEPGVFRTDFLDESSAAFGAVVSEDYSGFSAKVRAACAAGNHQQTGDPAKLGAALVELAGLEKMPLRYLAGSDAYAQASAKLKRMLDEVEQWRKLSASTDGL